MIVECLADRPDAIPESGGGYRLINRQDLFQESRGRRIGQMRSPLDLKVFEFRTYAQRYRQSNRAKRFVCCALIALANAQLTVHKSQGSEFLHTAFVLPPGGAKVLTRELVYTGITRAWEQFTLIEAQEGLFVLPLKERHSEPVGWRRT